MISLLETILPINKSDVEQLDVPAPSKNNDLAFVFDNFLRDRLAFNLIKSIFRFYPGSKIYIADQSVYNKNTMLLYGKLTAAGHSVNYCGFDCGISVARNTAIAQVKEPYIFVCDCDNLIEERTNIETLKTILKNNSEIGFVGMYEIFSGKINNYEHFLNRKDKLLKYETISKDAKIRLNPFFLCDYTMNSGLAKKEIFESVKYEEQMKLCEHLDFFMQLKYNTSWKVACATNVCVNNSCFALENEDYKKLRGRNKLFWDFYITKWGLEQINDYSLVRKITIGK
jgi:hypothetical protein